MAETARYRGRGVVGMALGPALVVLAAFNCGGSPGPDPVIQALVDQVNQANISATVQDLSDPMALPEFTTRHTKSPTFPMVTDYLKQRCEGLGLTTSLHTWTRMSITASNVVCEISGATNPENIYIIGAHYDSTTDPAPSPPDYEPAPGATDNASGVAGALEMARIFLTANPGATLRFLFFAGEEQNLLGSKEYVEKLDADGELNNVELMLDIDEIGRINDLDPDNEVCNNPPAQTGPGMLGVCLESSSAHASVLDAFQSAGQLYTSLFFRRNLSPFGSDHISFLNEGVPALLTIEAYDGNNPVADTVNDVFAELDPELTAEIIKMNSAALARLVGVDP
ncbi:MAG: M20/M25/M40 family metallo-hydrolase [Deinococcus sp.]|nr:M20/M25/M40 family metallo-hydrolase [Deinococcus sp.]